MESLPSANPDWENKIETVTKLAVKGFTISQIIAKTEFPDYVVRKILRDNRTKACIDKVQDKITQEAFRHKVPMLKEIVSMSLTAIKETLEDLKDPEVRKEMLSRPSDLAALSKIATDLNALLRLELGQSTQNVETISHNYQETKIILQDLKKKDPVFDYPDEEG